LGSITKGEATEWRLSLVAKGNADATVRKYSGFAKQFFKHAVERELIPKNPFSSLVSSPVGNEERQFFVTRGMIQKVLDAAPDATWRLIIALSRYGGLRVPSEIRRLRWTDVNWELKRLHVTSPKTKRYAGHGSRMIPLFPQLMPYLEACWEEAELGAEYIFPQYASRPTWNPRTRMTRIVKQAGLIPWERIFHNMRSSRETELQDEFPAKAVCQWLGNSQQVALKHYSQVTDEHWERATRTSAAESGAVALQNAVQHVHAANCTDSQDQPVTSCDTSGSADSCEPVRITTTSIAEVHGNRTHQPHAFRTAQRF